MPRLAEPLWLDCTEPPHLGGFTVRRTRLVEIIVLEAFDDGIWDRLRLSHSSLRPIEQVITHNSFSDVTESYQALRSAEVVVEGETVGHFVWDRSRLLCPIEFPKCEASLTSVAMVLANLLGADWRIVDEADIDIDRRPVRRP